MSSAISTSGLAKTYAGRWFGPGIEALKPIDLSVEQGEVFGLLGPNGAGKTTLVKALLGIVSPTAGSAELLGVPVTRPAARARVGYLPENHRFPSYLSANHMLRFFGGMASVDEERLKDSIPSLLDLVGLQKWADTPIRKYSKGMMQRLGIAQSMVNDPDIIFLDEPTDGVDPLGRREIRDLLLELRDRGKTIFLNSHLLSEIEQVCDRVAILNHGECIKEASMDDLLHAGKGFDLQSTKIPDTLLAELPLSATDDRGSSGAFAYTVQVNTTAELNEVLDRIRTEGVLISGIAARRTSLEDYFIDVVADDTPGGR